MASAAGRGRIELPILMAINAFHLGMRLVQLYTGDGMFECLLIPTSMTSGAGSADPANSLSGRMAGAAFKLDMVLIKRPAG